MKITLLCTDPSHPVNGHLLRWIERNSEEHDIRLARTKEQLTCGDILFMIACTEIIGPLERKAFRASLVLHASDLPYGRGWSPHVWEIISGSDNITLSLLEAEDRVDSGRIWNKITFQVPKHALWNEVNELLFGAELELIDFAIKQFDAVMPIEQDKSIEPTYFRRRRPTDSKINPESSIASQFDLIRICEPSRYPAYFEMHGHRYKIILEKIPN